jgi:50S ribosomal protein L16 3-hydroxylase
VRAAIPGFRDPLAVRDVLALASHPDAQARLVQGRGAKWSLVQGPIAARAFARLPQRDWTVLVQDTQHFSRAAQELLQRFSVIPHARVDDLMVSYAVPGGSVGPHVDSYDVFLLQGVGRRRWRISRQADHAFRPGLPLKILRRFVPEEDWVLEAGDMLYLPPHIAHHGVAETECLTWSIGFRAPTDVELAGAFLDHLADRVALEGRFGDPGRKPARHAGEIPADFLRHAARTVDRIRWRPRDVAQFAGRYLSEPKAHVFFTPPARTLTRARFLAAARVHGIALEGKSRLLFSGRMFFMNGECFTPGAAQAKWLRRLADARSLPTLAGAPAGAATLAYEWYARGYVRLREGDEK